MKHQFSVVPHAEIPRSRFDRSFGYKTTFDAGLLIPFFADEALPGDTFRVESTLFARLATPIFPVMDNMYMDTQYFAVPMRLIWDNWERFMGAQTNPGDSTDFLIPIMGPPDASGWAENSLADYFGIPVGVDINHSAMWHRAYNLIWAEWYRDQNLQNSPTLNRGDGPDLASDYIVQRRGKRHDYFTSCLPFPQKGESITIPLGTTAPVIGNSLDAHWSDAETENSAIANMQPTGEVAKSGNLPGSAAAFRYPTDAASSGLVADLSDATAATINELRQSFQIQKLLERDARGGTRYTEIIRAHFGVSSPDSRLQRPEYLGGGSTPIMFSQVPQTSETDPSGPDASPQGNLAAYATVTAHNHGFTKSFTEHCILIGLVSVRADLTYQQGLDRMFSRRTKFDFYFPALSHIGEQAVLNQEIFMAGSPADTDVFGYQERSAEYRYKPSKITGAMRSASATSLDAWHLSQDFAGLPVLDAAFIIENPPVDRVIAVTGEPHFIFDSYTRMECVRPMPMYGVPGLIDHF